MQDVRAVKALALLNEGLRPDHLLRRTQAQRQSENLLLDGMLEPAVVHTRHAVAGAENQIDEGLAAMNFGEPVRKRHLDVIAPLAQRRQRARDVVLAG